MACDLNGTGAILIEFVEKEAETERGERVERGLRRAADARAREVDEGRARRSGLASTVVKRARDDESGWARDEASERRLKGDDEGDPARRRTEAVARASFAWAGRALVW